MLGVLSQTSKKLYLSVNKIRLFNCIAGWIVGFVAIETGADQSKVGSFLCVGLKVGVAETLYQTIQGARALLIAVICSVALQLHSDAH